MSCYYPLQVFQHKYLKGKVLFDRKYRYNDLYAPLKIPCSQCIGCRLEHARQWAMRCMHEAALYEDNCFITLTYDNDHLPKNGFLERRDFQLFMKRLRKHFAGVTIRTFYCGEYGSKLGRPHFHAILFNLDFHDKLVYKQVRKKDGSSYFLYNSETLDKIWRKGFAVIGNVTSESAGYVAQYTLKKKTGEQAADHYEYVDPITFEVFQRPPEFAQASLGKAIGKGWYEKFKSDVFPSDEIIVNSRAVRPPQLYLDLLELDDPVLHAKIKEKRATAALQACQKEVDAVHAYDVSRKKRKRDVEAFINARLQEKEVVVKAKLSLKRRARE